MKNNSTASEFVFEGVIPSSKSTYNRALIIQSYEPKIKVMGEGKCDDITKMQSAVMSLLHHETQFDCGEAGTVLRFLALRVSRETGSFLLTGKPRLFRRPQTELLQIFSQLQVRYQMEERGLRIESRGWKLPTKPLRVSAKESSQFLSGILLNCWNLPMELKVEIPQEIVSGAYFALTQEILREFGLVWHQEGEVFVIPPSQKPKVLNYVVESDVSSAFAVAALAAVAGKAVIKQFPFTSKQPDLAFVKILTSMGVPVEQKNQDLVIHKAERMRSLDINLENCPDLFPVLSALGARAEGATALFGAPQLKYKESNRIEEVVTLLQRLGVHAEARPDGAVIHGQAHSNTNEVVLDAKEDHRLVMMGAVLKAAGFNLRIDNTESVAKSFPEFTELAKGFL
jgi:3-phosphoshikimate 1-carboxyvinyltransferase